MQKEPGERERGEREGQRKRRDGDAETEEKGMIEIGGGEGEGPDHLPEGMRDVDAIPEPSPHPSSPPSLPARLPEVLKTKGRHLAADKIDLATGRRCALKGKRIWR